jgi:hypothetical protein
MSSEKVAVVWDWGVQTAISKLQSSGMRCYVEWYMVNHLQAAPNYQLQITNLSSMYHSGCGENWITQDTVSGFTLPEDSSGHDALHSWVL